MYMIEEKALSEAIEQMRCAEANCDNMVKVSPTPHPFLLLIKLQIQHALKALGAETLEEVFKKGAQSGDIQGT